MAMVYVNNFSLTLFNDILKNCKVPNTNRIARTDTNHPESHGSFRPTTVLDCNSWNPYNPNKKYPNSKGHKVVVSSVCLLPLR